MRKSGKSQPLHAHLRDTFLLDLGAQEKELLRYCCILPPAGADVVPELRSEAFLCALFGKEADKPGFHNLLARPRPPALALWKPTAPTPATL